MELTTTCLFPFYPFYQVLKCIVNFCSLIFLKKTQKLGTHKDIDSPMFDTQALCVTFAWGFPLVGTAAFLLTAFYKVPVASYLLPLYLLNAFQIFIVVISLLITYKVLQINEPEARTFIKNIMAGYYESKQKCQNVGGDETLAGREDIPDEEVQVEGNHVEEKNEMAETGKLAGQLIQLLIREYSQRGNQRASSTQTSSHTPSSYGANDSCKPLAASSSSSSSPPSQATTASHLASLKQRKSNVEYAPFSTKTASEKDLLLS